MLSREDKIFIGTSGWQYWHWRKIFYPENLPSKDWLNFYSRHFKTTEINSSFYHLPRKKTFENWSAKTPKGFLFAVKVWRRITHLKKLKNIQNDFKTFYERALALGEKFGPLLFQFPPSFKVSLEKLENLGKLLRKIDKEKHCAFEFRHESWFIDKVYQILKKYNLALCWADTPCYPYEEEITADYVYIRLHGHTTLYTSKYTKNQLMNYAKKIKKLIQQDKTVYVYFDNDAYGYAIENAKELKDLIKL